MRLFSAFQEISTLDPHPKKVVDSFGVVGGRGGGMWDAR